MKYPKYPAYKDSGVEWIGKIPEHCKLLKLKYLTWCLDSNRIPLNAQERSFREGQVEYWGANGVIGYVDKFLFNEEIVLIGEDGAPFNEKFKEVAFYVNKPIWPNNHIHVLKTRTGALSNFIKHSLNSCDFTNFIEGSTRDKLTQSKLLQIPIVICDTNEQEKILLFLENKISIIDKITSKLQNHINLLKEKRQAIITNAVTKGLDPNVPMKDSGVEWIGKIPEHWKLSSIKFVSEVTMGQSPPSDFYLDSGNLPFLQGCADFGEIFPNSKHYCEVATKTSGPGDILLSVRAPVGEINLSDRVYGIGRGLCSIKPLTTKGDYLKWYLFAAKNKLISISNGSTYDSVAINDVKNLEISISMVEFEQNAICEYLNTETTKIELLISKHLRLIDLLKEYKTSLITQAVTGKIDVRDFAPPTTSNNAQS